MANRRLLDRSHDVATISTATPSRSNKKLISVYLQSRTLLLSLALVSCLIPINCASFGQRTTKQHQWLPRILNEPPNSHLDNSFTYKALELANGPYYSQPDSPSAPSLDWLEMPLSSYNQLRSTGGIKEGQLLSTAPLPHSTSRFSFEYPSGYSRDSSFDQTDYDLDKISERLSHAKNLEGSSPQDAAMNEDDLLNVFKYADPNNLIYASNLPDQSSRADNFDDGSTHDQLSQVQQGAAPKTPANIVENKSEKSSSKTKGDKNVDVERKFTTLLEDEGDMVDATTSNSVEKEVTIKENNTHDSLQRVVTKDETSFGTLANSAESPSHEAKETTSEGNSLTSVFNRMYQKLAKYVPFLNHLHQTATVSNATTTGTATSAPSEVGSIEKSPAKDNQQKDAVSEKKIQSSSEHSSTKAKNEEVKQTTTKQDFSALAESKTSNDGQSTRGGKVGTSIQNEVQIGLDELDEPSTEQLSSSEVNNNDKTEESFQHSEPKQTKKDRTPASLSYGTDKNDDRVELYQQQDYGDSGKNQKVHYLRQSNLAMPLKASDELVDSEGLVGKYIYGLPEQGQKYISNGKAYAFDQDRTGHSLAHEPFARHLRPGDEVYSSYRPVYTQHPALIHADPTLGGLVGNKPNDFYFLVMVAAFCAMAVAVVLAAGLFAYRVQLNRKSTTETDYPTYGVVGPNNMSGKCNAAAFVGGYFGSIGGPGSNSSTGNSKTGSIKHLPDAYSGSDSGVVASSCGSKNSNSKRTLNEQTSNGAIKSADFMASQNAARMYHYQHQKQQMIISDRASTGRHTSASDLDSEEENDDGSYTVYECPGLASAHEMEIKNPLFNDDQTP